MVYNSQQPQQPPNQPQQQQQNAPSGGGPRNFYDYAQRRDSMRQRRQPPAWGRSPGGPPGQNQNQQYQPGQVSRPDGRPQPGGYEKDQRRDASMDMASMDSWMRRMNGGIPQDFGGMERYNPQQQEFMKQMLGGGGQAYNSYGQPQQREEGFFPGGGSMGSGQMWNPQMGQMMPMPGYNQPPGFLPPQPGGSMPQNPPPSNAGRSPGYIPQPGYSMGNYGVTTTRSTPTAPPPANTTPGWGTPTSPTPGPTPAQPVAPTKTPVNHRDPAYAGVDFNKLNPGDPVQGKPGATWNHNGQGWEIVSGGSAAGNPSPTPGSTSSSSSVAGMEYFNSLSPYEKTQVNVDLPEMYSRYQGTNFGTDPFTSYGFDPSRISQFTGPNQGQTQKGVNELMQSLLQNPTSMTDAGVSALKDKQKETSLALQKSAMGANAEEMARSGRFGGGGYQAQNAAIQGQMGRDVLSGYRDIDLKKMEQDFKDKQSVATLGDLLMTGEMGRSTDAYRARLEGETEREQGFRESARSKQEAENLGLTRTKYQSDEGFREYESGKDQFNSGLAGIEAQLRAAGMNIGENQYGHAAGFEQAKAQAGLAESDATRQLQKYLAEQGFDIDRSKITSGERIANMGNETDRYGINTTARTQLMDMFLKNKQYYSGLGQNESQFGRTLGYNQQGQDNDMFKWFIENGVGGA